MTLNFNKKCYNYFLNNNQWQATQADNKVY